MDLSKAFTKKKKKDHQHNISHPLGMLLLMFLMIWNTILIQCSETWQDTETNTCDIKYIYTHTGRRKENVLKC